VPPFFSSDKPRLAMASCSECNETAIVGFQPRFSQLWRGALRIQQEQKHQQLQ